TIRSTQLSAGVLKVTLGATGSGGTNRLQQVRFGTGTNAVISTGSLAEANGNFDVSLLPEGTVEYTFTIRRAAAGQSTTVPLTIVDGCGEWKTFVGGGPNAF